ncbi:MAG TPA: phage holin family protein [Candidatus Paceibacterota bacterium]
MIMRPIVNIVAIAATLLVLSNIGIGISVSSFYIAIIVAIIWGLMNLTIGPLINLLALPINVLTLGLFSFVINALLFWFISSFVQGFVVTGFIPALVGSIILSAVSYFVRHLLKPHKV